MRMVLQEQGRELKDKGQKGNMFGVRRGILQGSLLGRGMLAFFFFTRWVFLFPFFP